MVAIINIDIYMQALGMFLMSLSSFYVAKNYLHGRKYAENDKKYKQQMLVRFEENIQKKVTQILLDHEQKSMVWEGFREFRIFKKEMENKDNTICSFYLEPVDGAPVAPYKPGQYLIVSLPDGENSMRCYSLSQSSRSSRYYRITVRKIPDGLSAHLHDNTHEGDILNIKTPRGDFCLNPERNKPVVMLAGGIGITPFISMIDSECRSIDSQRDIRLFLGVRNRNDHPMYDYLKETALRHANIQVRSCYSRSSKEDVLNVDYHYAERINIDLLKRVLPSNNFLFYICGPLSMQKDLIQGLLDWDVPEKDIYHEFFGEEPTKMPVKTPIEINFERSGKKVTWDGHTLLNIAEINQIDTLKRGCGCGICGSCKVCLKEGSVHYLREPMYDQLKKKEILPCICVPLSNVTVEA